MKLISKYVLLTGLSLLTLAGIEAPSAMAQTNIRAGTAELQDALKRIARNSNDSSALADAGLAALKLGDTRAAIGFLAKADEIYPRSGRVKAGLARALLKEKNPFGALRYFDEAIANGVAAHSIAADRGLAYDLIGRNEDAQKDYELASQHDPSDLLSSRHAISLGISGNIAASDEKLASLLQKSDRGAWRTRVFILAMNGQTNEANKIARQTMAKRMAQAIKPFLVRMPKLTAAQKAAAVHFGHFPASENVGVDVASVRYAANTAVRGGEGADAGLIPLGKPLGEDANKPRVLAMPDQSERRRPGVSSTVKETESAIAEGNYELLADGRGLPAPSGVRPPIVSDNSRSVAQNAAVPKPVVTMTEKERAIKNAQSASPGFETAIGQGTGRENSPAVVALPQVASGADTSGPPLVSRSVERKVKIGNVEPPADKPETVTKQPVQLVNFDLAESLPDRGPPANSGAEKKALSEIIGSIEIPDSEKASGVVPVDLAAITPAKPKVKEVVKVEEAKPKKVEPKHPKRFWVQIATGSNMNALKYDYRRFSKKNTVLFKGVEGWTSPWGRMTRLVVGPFSDLKAAKKFEAGYRKTGGDGFAWVSANGTEVKKLAAK
ncbi:SPOR domain-containing protein [Parasphingorhabdus sp.]|uniref:SPOR domain-containing protein n=1 Tax=Parasphingorhabdus sp. TaxID=2709688 RepID=UPI003263DA90